MGSVAPDLAYALDGSGLPVWPLSHQPLGLLIWCLPIVGVAARCFAAALPRSDDAGWCAAGTASRRTSIGDRSCWTTAVGVAAPAVAAVPFLPGAFSFHTTGARPLCAVPLGLVVATIVVTWRGPVAPPAPHHDESTAASLERPADASVPPD